MSDSLKEALLIMFSVFLAGIAIMLALMGSAWAACQIITIIGPDGTPMTCTVCDQIVQCF